MNTKIENFKNNDFNYTIKSRAVNEPNRPNSNKILTNQTMFDNFIEQIFLSEFEFGDKANTNRLRTCRTEPITIQKVKTPVFQEEQSEQELFS